MKIRRSVELQRISSQPSITAKPPSTIVFLRGYVTSHVTVFRAVDADEYVNAVDDVTLRARGVLTPALRLPVGVDRRLRKCPLRGTAPHKS
jgi:hypothetical protein